MVDLDREMVMRGLACIAGIDWEKQPEECPCVFRWIADENEAQCESKVAEYALKLLKEQEPKRVVITTNSYGTNFYHCPRCSRDICAYPRQLYCSRCGQAVKWDD